MRSEQSVKLLMSKPKLTYDDFVALKYTNDALLADRILPELLAAAASSDDANVKAAVAVLKDWITYSTQRAKAHCSSRCGA